MQPATTPRLEAMSIGAMVDRSIQMYSEMFPVMIGIALITGVPFILVDTLGEAVKLSPEISSAEELGKIITGLAQVINSLVLSPLCIGALTLVACWA